MSKKKRAKPAKRSKGELSPDDLDSVAGGILMASPLPPIAGDGAPPLPASSGSLTFVKFEATYKEQDSSSGKASGDSSMGWPMGKKK